jgi:nitrous oxidase accessory protein NosD
VSGEAVRELSAVDLRVFAGVDSVSIPTAPEEIPTMASRSRLRIRAWLRVFVPMLGLVASLMAATPAWAARTVDCNADPSALQPAIDQAKPGATLLVSGTCVGSFTISKDLTLKGEPLAAATIGDPSQVGVTLTVSAGAVVMIRGITISSGLTNAGSLTLFRSAVIGSATGDNDVGVGNTGTMLITLSSVRGVDARGAECTPGVSNLGKMVIDRSTISNNNSGGVIVFGGSVTITRSTIRDNFTKCQDGAGIFNNAVLKIYSSTIADNRVSNFDAGGIANWTLGSLTLISSTVSGNETDGAGGGIENLTGGTAMTAGSIVAGNAPANDCSGSFVSGGYNLIGIAFPGTGGSSCNFSAQPTDLVGSPAGGIIDPRLAPLGHYGGPTDTMFPRSTSPALDVIPVGALATDGTPLCPSSGSIDQRGFSRPQGPACDIGADERKA